jgi:hypothetical protein
VLLRSAHERARAFAGTLYSALFLLYTGDGGYPTTGMERVVRSIAGRVLSVSSTGTEVEVRPANLRPDCNEVRADVCWAWVVRLDFIGFFLRAHNRGIGAATRCV